MENQVINDNELIIDIEKIFLVTPKFSEHEWGSGEGGSGGGGGDGGTSGGDWRENLHIKV